jgi:hypothetical protein
LSLLSLSLSLCLSLSFSLSLSVSVLGFKFRALHLQGSCSTWTLFALVISQIGCLVFYTAWSRRQSFHLCLPCSLDDRYTVPNPASLVKWGLANFCLIFISQVVGITDTSHHTQPVISLCMREFRCLLCVLAGRETPWPFLICGLP